MRRLLTLAAVLGGIGLAAYVLNETRATARSTRK